MQRGESATGSDGDDTSRRTKYFVVLGSVDQRVISLRTPDARVIPFPLSDKRSLPLPMQSGSGRPVETASAFTRMQKRAGEVQSVLQIVLRDGRRGVGRRIDDFRPV